MREHERAEECDDLRGRGPDVSSAAPIAPPLPDRGMRLAVSVGCFTLAGLIAPAPPLQYVPADPRMM